MKTIIVASAFLLAASAAVVPFNEKPSVHIAIGSPQHKQEASMKPHSKPTHGHKEGPRSVHEEKPAAHPKKAATDKSMSKHASSPKEAAADKPMSEETAVESDIHHVRREAASHPKKAAAHKSTPKGDKHASSPNMSEDKPMSEEAVVESDIHHVRRDAPTDTDILQYALTLEHLEKAFYDGALKRFNAKAFAKAGFPFYVRERFQEIAAHEAEHVTLLTGAIGANAVAACNYTFPYHDVKSFAALSMVLEGVGVSAYLGAAQFIQSKEYLTVAGSILTTEARHAAFVASTVDEVAPWSGAFDTPLDLDQVYSLAAGFITGCPSTNAALPVKAFPTLTIKNKEYAAGEIITLEFDASSANGQPTFLAIYSGLETFYAPIENNKAKLPASLEGTSYGLVSTSNSTVTDSNTVAGMAVFETYPVETGFAY